MRGGLAVGAAPFAVGGLTGAGMMGGVAGLAPEVGALYSGMDAATLAGADLAGAGAAGAAGSGAMNYSGLDLSGVGDIPGYGGAGAPTGGSMMPGAVPESTAQLKDWGLQETAPGQWTQPPASSGIWDAVGKYGATAVSALKQFFASNPNPSQNDLTSILGRIAPAALGIIGSNNQTAAYQRLADRYDSYGASYRARLGELYKDPSSFLKSPEVTVPVQQGTDIMAHSLSTQGNPTGSGSALQHLQSYASDQLFGRLGEEKNRLGTLGGISSGNAAAPVAASTAVGSQANAYNAAGAGINDIFNPPKTMAQTMNEYMTLQKAMGGGATA